MALSLVVFVALPALSLSLAAQEGEAAAMPEGWMVRLDRAGGSAPGFEAMSPGWHITTGPAGIFYDPEKTASGTFRVESEVFQFDPGSRNEAYGVFIGGKDLDADGQSYTYFLIRRDGSYLVKRRDGAGTSNVQGWTTHAAVVSWENRGEGEATARNVLAIEAGGEELVFFVNGQEVFRTARQGQHVDGVVGLRANHGLNIHVSSLDITQIG
jgi:hypothetical protein